MEGDVMKRLGMTAIFVLTLTVGFPIITVEPVSDLATTPVEPSCASGAGLKLAQGGCCQGRGGVCGCAGRTIKCCNGTSASGTGCACRSSDLVDETASARL
jgi:hypothetical protein